MVDSPLLRGAGLTKIYGDLVALSDVDFSLAPGEVRALIGSNGAGKSTLVKILTGAVAPTHGVVEIRGQASPLGDPREMIRRGVACIYQHANLAPAMSVMDNIFLGRQPTNRFGFVDARRQRRQALDLLDRHGIALDLDATVGELPTVKQKEVEIIKALALDARVILMDEPTAWLANTEVAKLHATIRTLKQSGVGIVYISHVLDEIFAVCDTVTIMRDGKNRRGKRGGRARPAARRAFHGRREAGAPIGRSGAAGSPSARDRRGRLQARNLTRRGVFSDVSFDLYAGEIFCLTGLIGSKRTELVRTLFGADRFDSGALTVDGALARLHAPADAIARGIGFVPEDRHRDGLMLDMTVTEIWRWRRSIASATASSSNRRRMIAAGSTSRSRRWRSSRPTERGRSN